MTQTARRLASGAPPGPTVKRGTDILEGPYPRRFDDFVGQDLARTQLISAIRSAIRRNATLGHVLLASGIPGVGKTTLARLTAALLDTGFVEIGGAVTDKDAIRALRVMQDGDVLFIDEIHRLVSGGKARAEWLLTLLQDGMIQTPGGSFMAPDICVIAATTDVQRLPETIWGRFPIRPVLDEYTDEEAVQIAKETARRVGFGVIDDLPMPSDDVWLEPIARAANNNPRAISNLLTQVRDIAISSELDNYTDAGGYDASQALTWSGLSEDGLPSEARNYLMALHRFGGTASIETIKASIAEEKVTQTEKLLIQKGLIVISSRGRSLTIPEGWSRAEEFIAATKEVE